MNHRQNITISSTNSTYQDRLLVYVENTHTPGVFLTLFITSFLTVPLTTRSSFWHIQRLFRI